MVRVSRGARVWRSLVASWRSKPFMVVAVTWCAIYASVSAWLAFAGWLESFWWSAAVYAAGLFAVGLLASRAERRRRLRVSRGSS